MPDLELGNENELESLPVQGIYRNVLPNVRRAAMADEWIVAAKKRSKLRLYTVSSWENGRYFHAS
jgi:hypothetical protein